MVWLFDYDLTLYGTEERCVINSLDHRISLFVQKTVGGDFESAHKIRTDYLERFGTTLAGLMAMNNTDPDDFFDFIHVPDFLTYPKKAPEKLALLQSLKGPRFVFTNGRHDWSEAGMAHMGIDSAIDGVFDLKQLDWVGKPHDSAYVKMEAWLAQKLPRSSPCCRACKARVSYLPTGATTGARRAWPTWESIPRVTVDST